MNVSSISSIKFSEESAKNTIEPQNQKSESKFSQLKQKAVDYYEKMTPEDTNKVFLASAVSAVASSIFGHGSNRVFRAISKLGAVAAVVSLGVAFASMNKRYGEEKIAAAEKIQPVVKIPSEENTETKLVESSKDETPKTFVNFDNK